MTRIHYKQILMSAQLSQNKSIENKLKIVRLCHGMKVNDCYWLKTNKYDTYADYNIYNQYTTNRSIEVSLNGSIQSLSVNDLLCDLVTDGNFPKAWIQLENELYLLKTAYDDKGIKGGEFIKAEIQSAEIVKSIVPLGVVEYSEYCINTACSICKCFTNEHVMFVPYDDLYLKYPTKDDFINDFHDEVKWMLQSDLEVHQIDRHGGNFGVLVDADNNEVLGFAPMFDYNLSGDVAKKLLVDTAYFEPFKMSMIDAYNYVKVFRGYKSILGT